MKTVMIIADGLGDEPIPKLKNKTPLECAFIPHIHYIATQGKIGRIHTTFPGLPIESMVCIMGLIGYEPTMYYPHGRSSFEALAKGIPLTSDDLILRCNIISVDTKHQVITDFTAGLISNSKARKKISQIKLPSKNWELYPGQSYRNILIIRGANLSPASLKCHEPHMHIGEYIPDLLPVENSSKAESLAKELRQFLLDSQKQLSQYETEDIMIANMLWVWSPSIKPVWPSFKETTGLSAAFVGGLDFLHGIAMAADIHFDLIPGATGYIDTDYKAKGETAIRYLKDFDFVLVHINAPDEEAHQHSFLGKISAIEKIDYFIVGPILHELSQNHKGNFRMVVCGDHNTRCFDGKHTADPVPFAIFGKKLKKKGVNHFCEQTCSSYPPILSLDFFKRLTNEKSNEF